MAVIAVTTERRAGETRVAAVPETVKKLIAAGFSVVVESGAGTAAMAHVDRWAGCDPGPVAPALSSGAGFVVVDEVDGRWEARLVDVTAPPDRAVCPVGLPSDDPPEPGVCRTSPAPLRPCPRPAGGPSPARTASQPP